MSKQNDKTNIEAEDNLLNALESIKNLLEKSEARLTTARESITHTNQSGKSRIPAKDDTREPAVPVLDDIVEPETYGFSLGHDEPSAKQFIPETTEAITSKTGEGMNTRALLDYLDVLQKNLEKNVRNTLMRSVVNVEKEVKKTINEQLDAIRRQIRDKK